MHILRICHFARNLRITRISQNVAKNTKFVFLRKFSTFDKKVDFWQDFAHFATSWHFLMEVPFWVPFGHVLGHFWASKRQGGGISRPGQKWPKPPKNPKFGQIWGQTPFFDEIREGFGKKQGGGRVALLPRDLHVNPKANRPFWGGQKGVKKEV